MKLGLMLYRWLKILGIGVPVALGAGCATDGARPADPATAAARPAAYPAGDEDLAAVLGRAAPGAATVLPTASGGPATLVVEREYHAASGRLCRRLSLSRPGSAAEARVACRDAVGVWRLLPRLANRALPAVAAPPDLHGASAP